MASSSASYSSQTKRYDVFTSFHGPDVRQGFLSHLYTHFESRGIRPFNDQGMERGHTIGPELVQAIRESRVWIVVLSEKYASSSWCLDELVEIFNCKGDQGQNVIPIFYKVYPSDVKKQSGDFGKAFEKTCEGKSEEVKDGWSKALADVATIAGEHSLNWPNEAEMIQKIATDVLEKLINATPSSDFEDKVGLGAHLIKLDSLLRLESDDVKMIGIWGPAGIGKSTIAEALYSQISSSFELKCSMENLKGSCKSKESKLALQSQLLSKIFNQKDMRVYHLGAIKGCLHDQRVLIILDDVDDREQLKALAKDISWFGSGSRIIVTTKDKRILKAHGINDFYHVDFPSEKEALEILCLSAFKQRSVPDGFEELAKEVVEFCGKLPLGLCVVGSSLRGKSKDEWELQLSRIETSLDGKIEDVLRVGYDRLKKKDQSLFLHIACLFNNDSVEHASSLLADSHDVEIGLKNLAEQSLVHTNGNIVMHYLLQKLGRQIVRDQSDEPGKRQFLLEFKEIRDVLRKETGTGSVLGISLDTYTIGKDDHISVGKRAFENEDHLVEEVIVDLSYTSRFGAEAKLQIPEDMEYLSQLTLLHWDLYPIKSLPTRFQPDRLVELHMPNSNLDKLWEGIKHLPKLKSIDLNRSFELIEIPNLLRATNLETLNLAYCTSLVELPSSIRNLHKLKKLKMDGCEKLEVIPTNINLASLEEVWMWDCYRLRSFPDFSTNIIELRLGRTQIEEIPSSIRNLHKLKLLNMYGCKNLRVIPTNINLPSLEFFSVDNCSQLESFPDISSNVEELRVSSTKIEDVPTSVVRRWSRLESLSIGSSSLKRLTHVPLSVTVLNLSNSDIEGIPDCVIGLPHLLKIIIKNCSKIVSITALPPSLESLYADECVSLKKVSCSFHKPMEILSFNNCEKLDEESRRQIIKQSVDDYISLPGNEIPAEFTHKATGKSITIPLAPRGDGTFSASSRFKACILLSPNCRYHFKISCSQRSKGDLNTVHCSRSLWIHEEFLSEHLFIFSGDLIPQQNRCHEVDVTINEITFEFSCEKRYHEIIGCGVEIMKEEAESSSREHATTTTTLINATPSRDFEDKVGLEAHLTEMNSLLDLESNDVKMIGIWGPAGIGSDSSYRKAFSGATGSGSSYRNTGSGSPYRNTGSGSSYRKAFSDTGSGSTITAVAGTSNSDFYYNAFSSFLIVRELTLPDCTPEDIIDFACELKDSSDLNALVGSLRAAFERCGIKPKENPFRSLGLIRYQRENPWKKECILVFTCSDYADVEETSFINHMVTELDKREVTPLTYNLLGIEKLDAEIFYRCSIGILVLSDSFSRTSQSLDHLVAIMEHCKEKDIVVIPVYFRVAPSDILEGQFEAVNLQYPASIQADIVQNWKAAIAELASIDGYQWTDGTQFTLAKEVARKACLRLSQKHSENLVRILALLDHPKPSDAEIEGIWGMAGIGKTSIAREFFEILAPQYDVCYFLQDFHQICQSKGLRQIRDDFFSKVFGEEKLSIGACDTKSSFMRDWFHKKTILVVLDDVSNARDAEYVIGGFGWFSHGHRIILTSRRKQVLVQCKVKKPYEIQKLEEFESFRLCKQYLEEEESDVISEIMRCSSGIPLALKVFGSSVSKQHINNMMEHLHSLRRNPPTQIQEAFRRSFDGLDENGKNIFLDLACFFRGENKDHVVQLLDACGFLTNLGICDLIDESLISLVDNKIEIPIPFQDIGRYIVHEEDKDPCGRSRLWDSNDIPLVLINNTGTEAIEGIFLDASDLTCELSPSVFDKMYNLRLLRFYCSTSGNHYKLRLPEGLDTFPDELRLLHWENYPLKYLPQQFNPENLVEVNMPYSKMEKLWEGKKNLGKLKKIKLSHSRNLTDILMLSEALNLEHIDLEGCTSLVDVSTSIPCGKLVSLNLKDCSHLRTLPSMVDLTSLKLLNMSGCSELEEIQDFAPNLNDLYLAGTSIRELPMSIKNLTELVTLDLENCRRLQKLPSGLSSSGSIVNLKLSGCISLELGSMVTSVNSHFPRRKRKR